MTASGMTLKTLEHRSGYSATALSELLRGNYYPSWLLTYTIVRTLDMPAPPMLRLWRAAAHEACKEPIWITRSIEDVAAMQPEDPPLAFQGLVADMIGPYTDYARVFLQVDDRARGTVARAFDILWVRWDEAIASHNPYQYAWEILRNQVIARAPRHTDGSPDLRAAAWSARVPNQAVGLADRISSATHLSIILDSVGRLPSDHRDVVVLHYTCGHEPDRVATITGTSPALVNSHLRHAHRILHEHHIADTPGAAP
ncbi:sigma factor-like helix-turn-helix DNA-binding protein [Streptomyces sp. NPDC002490]|uniref:sigma factor-like helix-turn-helix DNA-binding protein n=1 Tax=Streptomyces sp. NPDC002490 TaxID=3154416 RepID=UPI00332B8745